MLDVFSYRFSLVLLLSIVFGGVVGYLVGPSVIILKPLGDIFLNLLFTLISPLIFFSVAAAIANIDGLKKLARIFSSMLGVFLGMGIIAALFMLFIVTLFPPAKEVVLNLPPSSKLEVSPLANQIASMVSVPDFTQLFLTKNILPLILFSILIGFSTMLVGEKGKSFAKFLQAGSDIFMRAVSLIMYLAPIGFFAFFAILASEPNSQFFSSYLRVSLIYYIAAFLYFVVAFSCYAYLAGKKPGFKYFWTCSLAPAMTALATCSSAASLPVNLQAAKNMKIEPEIYETVIPLGTVLHKQGSILGGMIKIAFLFGIFQMDFTGSSVLITALLVSLLVGTVMGAIPSGGMLGEMLILSVYGLPPQALLLIATISIIIDPLATMLNVTGNTVASMLVARIIEGKNWLKSLNKQN